MNITTLRGLLEELASAVKDGDGGAVQAAALPLTQDVGYGLGASAAAGIPQTSVLREARSATHNVLEVLGTSWPDETLSVQGFAQGVLFALEQIVEGFERGAERSGWAEVAHRERAPLRQRVLDELRQGARRPSELVWATDSDKYQIARILADLEDQRAIEQAPLEPGDDRRFRRYRIVDAESLSARDVLAELIDKIEGADSISASDVLADLFGKIESSGVRAAPQPSEVVALLEPLLAHRD